MVLQIILIVLGFLAGTAAVAAAIAIARVWVTRQTTKPLLPGQLAEDRVKVARADRDIAELKVEEELHNLQMDLVLDARASKDLSFLQQVPEVMPPLPSRSDLETGTESTEEPSYKLVVHAKPVIIERSSWAGGVVYFDDELGPESKQQADKWW